LHVKTGEEPSKNIPQNIITFDGKFSKNDMHSCKYYLYAVYI
jgi:hypothetical protein